MHIDGRGRGNGNGVQGLPPPQGTQINLLIYYKDRKDIEIQVCQCIAILHLMVLSMGFNIRIMFDLLTFALY